MVIYIIVFLVIGFVIGFVADRVLIHYRREDLPSAKFPVITPSIDEAEYKKLKLYLKEWQVIIGAQMHFNDLILKFRSIVLTAFIALISATLAVTTTAKLEQKDVLLIFILISILWIAAFFIDFGYYNRMLLGSVSEAQKFDKAEMHTLYGLFGMTTNIGKHVHHLTSQILVIVYYALPLLALIILFLWKYDFL